MYHSAGQLANRDTERQKITLTFYIEPNKMSEIIHHALAQHNKHTLYKKHEGLDYSLVDTKAILQLASCVILYITDNSLLPVTHTSRQD